MTSFLSDMRFLVGMKLTRLSLPMLAWTEVEVNMVDNRPMGKECPHMKLARSSALLEPRLTPVQYPQIASSAEIT